jgi:hypothetical protein
MRTTLDLPDPLFREVKARAAQSGLKLKELLTRYIEAGLRARPLPAPQLKRAPLPTFKEPTGVAAQSLSNAQLQELLAKEDLESLTLAWTGAGKTP